MRQPKTPPLIPPHVLGRENKRTIYLDHAAATPLDGRVLSAMMPYLTSGYGNPSSLHHKGLEARQAVESSRKIIADILGARTEEIIFTSGGTESCNLAILGVLTTLPRIRSAPLLEKEGIKPGHIITTAVEHHAVLEPIKMLERQGWKVTYLPVDREGFVKVDDVKKAIRKNTALVSVMYANNEIGTIEPIAEIGRLISRINTDRQKHGLTQILFHTDACQAAGALDLNVNKLQVDLMSVSGSKIYGPKGAGFLYVRRRAAESSAFVPGGTSADRRGKKKRGMHAEEATIGLPLYPLILGGGQERGLRSGTENVAGIVGMAKALELAVIDQQKENKRLIDLRDYLITEIKKVFPKVILNGPQVKYHVSSIRYQALDKRLPNNINITFPGVEGEALMLYLDAYGICVSTGSACTTGSTDASHVLTAIGRTEKQAKESIRITLGKETKKKNLLYLTKVLKKVIPLILDER